MSSSPRKGTVLSALMWAASELQSARIESSRLDAEILLSEVLKVERLGIYLNFDRTLSRDEKNRFLSLVMRRKRREPTAYIINRKEFMSLKFYVDRDVLIPRPETECMLEWIINNISLSESSRVIDIGTGSGCIAISLLRFTEIVHIFATDIDSSALKIAEKNFEIHKNNKSYTLINTSLFDNIEVDDFDLIVSNPPYIKSRDIPNLMPEIVKYEPLIAIDGGENGDSIIYRLITDAHSHLRSGGFLVFEHSDEFVLNESLFINKYHLIFTGKDHSKRNRFTVLKKL